MKYSKPAHGEGYTEDNEEGLGSFVRKEGKVYLSIAKNLVIRTWVNRS